MFLQVEMPTGAGGHAGGKLYHLSDHMTVHEPAGVGDLQEVAHLHRLTLANSQILDQGSIEGGSAVGFGQTHLKKSNQPAAQQ